ncbi:LOW QUALITY PROTEIN: hypothetical protein CVT26_012051 [Gymnopilus dilepis]|uniref:Uncharacterized protein n=1 Tax=Gymnopilus dilepis TaxID=231916 RepID=A0A409WP34_9AGAR|nr:LOW QUALITY PROTEIN: hypothetical protein CVT26_012051 [Gymnopilus dilepis]
MGLANVEEKSELSRGLASSSVQAAPAAVSSSVPVYDCSLSSPEDATPATASAAAFSSTLAPQAALRRLKGTLLFPSQDPTTSSAPIHPAARISTSYVPHLVAVASYTTGCPSSIVFRPSLASGSVLPGSAAAAASGVSGALAVNSPAFATPGSGRVTPSLPRRRVSKKTQGRKASDAQAAEDAGVTAERSEIRGHVPEAATIFDDTGGGGVDDVGSTSSQTSASPSASAGLGDGDGNDPSHSRSRSGAHTRSQTQARPTSPTSAPLRLRARSQSRPRLTRHLSALDEHDDAGELGGSTPTSARLFVGQMRPQSHSRSHSQRPDPLPSVRSRGVCPRRLRPGKSPLRTSFACAADRDAMMEGDVFGVEGPRTMQTMRRNCREREGKMGRASGVEVGFLDADDGVREAVVEFWGLKEAGKHSDRTRNVVLQLVDSSTSDASSRQRNIKTLSGSLSCLCQTTYLSSFFISKLQPTGPARRPERLSPRPLACLCCSCALFLS